MVNSQNSTDSNMGRDLCLSHLNVRWSPVKVFDYAAEERISDLNYSTASLKCGWM